MTEIKPWQDRVKPGAFTGVKMEAMLAEIAELRAALAKSQPVERGAPVAWVRCHPDGTLTDELMPNSIIEVVRKYSGAWVPLFARPVCPMSDDDFISAIEASGIEVENVDAAFAIKRIVELFHDIKGATE